MSTSMVPTDIVGSPRERLLAAANELFYREGVHTVGIDRVIERAGVAKATLYSTFGSKDELIAAYLERRHDAMRDRVNRAIARRRSPRARLLAPFDVLIELSEKENYQGCAFANATAESHGPSADAAVAGYRGWLRETFADLAAQAQARHPAALARQLQLLWDGSGQSVRMDHDPTAARAARTAASVLLEAALPAGDLPATRR
ncbi:MAG TPA: TetR/AcrR family transcriptional regulator [Solirubrobacteraceae bacterium]|nr:TetR/AcrR family transcriptional regulator [Solirubrobacteraceae bacterium]